MNGIHRTIIIKNSSEEEIIFLTQTDSKLVHTFNAYDFPNGTTNWIYRYWIFVHS